MRKRIMMTTLRLLAGVAFVAFPSGITAGAATTVDTKPVSGFGGAPVYGPAFPGHLNQQIVGMASTPDGHGYWTVASDGGVFTFGDARYYGSTGAIHLNQPIVGMAADPVTGGYWLVAADGGVFSFNAPFFGSTGAIHLNQPIVGMAATPDGRGYWLVAADGGIFTFGDAHFYGSTGSLHLNQPVVGMATTPDAHGYWLAAADGGIFTFGDAHYYGSQVGKVTEPVVGIAASQDGRGYWVVSDNGAVLPAGDAPSNVGELGPPRPTEPIVGMARRSRGNGYWLVTSAIDELPPSTSTTSVIAACNLASPGPSVEPSEIILACADANAFFKDLTWSSWTTTGATGTGTYVQNNCTPDCAAGTFVDTPGVAVTLGTPWKTFAGYEFSSISYTLPGKTPSTFPLLITGEFDY